MNIAICDDEFDDLQQIKNYIQQYDSSFSISCYDSSTELLQGLEDRDFDVIFLDIEMQEPNGYDTAKRIKEQNQSQLIVFTTNSLDYAIRGYGIAFRYLPKPISYDLFSATMGQLEQMIVPQKVEIPASDQAIVTNINQIIYFESYGHRIVFHLTNGRTIESRSTIKTMLDTINISSIVQIHKSYCVNLNFVSSTTSTNIQLKDGTSLPIGRGKREGFRKALEKFIKET